MISFSVVYDSVKSEIAKYKRYRRFAFAPGVKRMQYKCNKLLRIFITIGFFLLALQSTAELIKALILPLKKQPTPHV